MSTKQTLALLTHNNTMKKKDPEGAVVFTLQTAALTVTSAVRKADPLSNHSKIV